MGFYNWPGIDKLFLSNKSFRTVPKYVSQSDSLFFPRG